MVCFDCFHFCWLNKIFFFKNMRRIFHGILFIPNKSGWMVALAFPLFCIHLSVFVLFIDAQHEMRLCVRESGPIPFEWAHVNPTVHCQ